MTVGCTHGRGGVGEYCPDCDIAGSPPLEPPCGGLSPAPEIPNDATRRERQRKEIDEAFAAFRERNRDLRRFLRNDLTDMAAKTLHYIETFDHPHATAAECLIQIDAGVERYRNEALFRAKVEMLVARTMEVIDRVYR